MPKTTIAVAMSGGVDSSTVAAMLRAEGHNVIGLTMQLWNQRRLAGRAGMPESVQGRCCSLDDVYDARRVAETIGIPYYVVNHEDRFEQDVVRPFVQEYLSGRTPIPCSLCNNHLKFDQLLVVAQQIGADAIATGHYARVEIDEQGGRWLLKRPADRSKDQTYFLFGLTQQQLSRTLFPLGVMTKPQVRDLARHHRLALAELRDPMRVQVKIRHRHEPASAQIEVSGTDEMMITFDQPQRAITPGQAAVFYDGDVVVGGGWIA